MNFGRGIKSILQDCQAGENLPGLDEERAHFLQDARHAVRSGGVEGFGGANLSHPYNHHFRETALNRSREAGVKFDSV